MKSSKIILLLIRYVSPAKNSFSEISLDAHHPATFLTQSGIWDSSWAEEFGMSMLDPINENKIIKTVKARIWKTANELKFTALH